MYAMDMRQYDPAIGRWVVQDPIVHFNYSPYSAFDNNPIYWADPSGADATSLIEDIIKKSTGESTTWTNNNDGTFSGSNGKSASSNDDKGDEKNNKNESIGINSLGSDSSMEKQMNPKDDIKEYQKNKETIKRNTLVLGILERFTATGQLKSSMQDAYSEWYNATHDPIPLEERDQILSDIDNMLNEMGVSATTAVPQLKIAAGIISAPIMAQNTYLTIRNDMVLAPRIKEDSPHWYSNNISHLDLGGGFSGGGAGGSYK